MTESKKPQRRMFLVGLLTGAGAAAALASGTRPAAARPDARPPADPAAPVLYRRTEDVERYYRTLYR